MQAVSSSFKYKQERSKAFSADSKGECCWTEKQRKQKPTRKNQKHLDKRERKANALSALVLQMPSRQLP